MTLSPAFLTPPIAHRGYHGDGRVENSLSAIDAAISQGFAIELDLQLSADGQAVVFHDYTLDRLTVEAGLVSERTAAELETIRFSQGTETIPKLSEVLQSVAGRAPLLIELKDQDGALGPNIGALERATATELASYDGPVALMSFNPFSVAALAELCPNISRGLTTCGFPKKDWPELSDMQRVNLARIPDLAQIGGCFISHEHTDLHNPAVARVKAQGLAVFTWTIRSQIQEAEARKTADNITFEGYKATLTCE